MKTYAHSISAHITGTYPLRELSAKERAEYSVCHLVQIPCGFETLDIAVYSDAGVNDSDAVEAAFEHLEREEPEDSSVIVREIDPREIIYSGIFDGLRGLEIEMTLEQALSCSHAGDCDDDVSIVVRKPEIAAQFDTIGAEKLRDGLKEAGAWDSEELADDEMNRRRAVWMAACDIREENR